MGNSPPLELDRLTEGMNLPGLSKTVTQENINLYAEASRDFNPIHIDEDFAKKTPLGGTIAHGMLVLAYVSQMMTAAFGPSWLIGGKLNVRFRNPARPGDTVTINGQVRRIEKAGEQTKVDCEISVQNQKGESIITGEASLEVKSNAHSS
ncbi:MAG: MaoC family dehydratase [Chloroflexota bacterium]